jgi:hypothetical protein
LPGNCSGQIKNTFYDLVVSGHTHTHTHTLVGMIKAQDSCGFFFLFSPFILSFFIFTYMCIHCAILFLLLWDKDSYTEIFLALLPCTCVLQPTLVHFYQTSLLLLDPLSKVSSANLRLLYLLLNREHINHIKILGILSFPYFSCACCPLSVWPMSNDITAFVLGL